MRKNIKLVALFMLVFIGMNGVKAASGKFYCSNGANIIRQDGYELKYKIGNAIEEDRNKEFSHDVGVRVIGDPNPEWTSIGVQYVGEELTIYDFAKKNSNGVYEFICPTIYGKYDSKNFVLLLSKEPFDGANVLDFSSSQTGTFATEKDMKKQDTSEKAKKEREARKSETKNMCTSMPNTIKLIKEIYTIMRYAIPVLVIVLSIIEFMKVVVNGDEKVYAEAWNKFIKRVIVGVIILLVPILIQVLLNISGIMGIYEIGNSSDIFCIFS